MQRQLPSEMLQRSPKTLQTCCKTPDAVVDEKISDDIDAVVEHFKSELGATWGQASVPLAQTSSKSVNPLRTVRP
eukprot:6197895-Pleurochrysis_carterae.AAC.1